MFNKNWELYSQAVIDYGKASQSKSRDLKHDVDHVDDEGIGNQFSVYPSSYQ